MEQLHGSINYNSHTLHLLIHIPPKVLLLLLVILTSSLQVSQFLTLWTLLIVLLIIAAWSRIYIDLVVNNYITVALSQAPSIGTAPNTCIPQFAPVTINSNLPCKNLFYHLYQNIWLIVIQRLLHQYCCWSYCCWIQTFLQTRILVPH